MTSRRILLVVIVVAFVLGTYLRLDQIGSQVLTNDEWHPVHQLTYYGPSHFMLTLGTADYSIPLVTLYWLWMKWFPLTELVVRMPMIVFGILTLIAFPLASRGRLDDRIVGLFACFLAFSPILVSYTRFGRPYAITLFGILFSYWCFQRAVVERSVRWRWAIAHAFGCGLLAWIHALVAPALVAPFLLVAWQTVRRKGIPWTHLLAWTAFTGALMAAAILPPLLHDPGAIAAKSGKGHLSLTGIWATQFMWWGTSSTILVLVFSGLAALGAATIWRSLPIARILVLGLGALLCAVVVTRPSSIQLAFVFARYFLPVVPLLLLAAAAGVIRIANALERALGNPLWLIGLAPPLFVAWWFTSPAPELLRRPNSYTQDAYFQYDYRPDFNLVRTVSIPHLPTTSFFSGLSTQPASSLTIAVAPYRYATFEWPGAMWEIESHQRVIPAFASGACEWRRHGEVPPEDDERSPHIHFGNAAHFHHWEGLAARGIDYFAYFLTKEDRITDRDDLVGLDLRFSAPLPHCEQWLRTNYPPPDYADGALLVWRINGNAPLPASPKVGAAR